MLNTLYQLRKGGEFWFFNSVNDKYHWLLYFPVVFVLGITWLISMPLWTFITIWKLINGEELWSPSIWSWYETLQKSVKMAFITCQRCWNRSANSISPTRQPSANRISSTRQPPANGISPIVLQHILQEKEDEFNRILQDKEEEINKMRTEKANCISPIVLQQILVDKEDEINKILQDKEDQIHRIQQNKEDEINRILQDQENEVNRVLQDKEDETNRLLQEKEDEINRIRTEAANDQANTSTGSCTICLQEFSNDRYKVAFNPCGHCCCHECAPQIQPCHECRRHIQNKVRLFE